jgi:hypothetical protein
MRCASLCSSALANRVVVFRIATSVAHHGMLNDCCGTKRKGGREQPYGSDHGMEYGDGLAYRNYDDRTFGPAR